MGVLGAASEVIGGILQFSAVRVVLQEMGGGGGEGVGGGRAVGYWALVWLTVGH